MSGHSSAASDRRVLVGCCRNSITFQRIVSNALIRIGDQEGEGATAYLSPRTARAVTAWTPAAAISDGPLFRRVNVRRFKAKAAVEGRRIDSISGRESWDLRKTLSKPAVPARVEYDVGVAALHPGSIGPIFRSMVQRAFDSGHL